MKQQLSVSVIVVHLFIISVVVVLLAIGCATESSDEQSAENDTVPVASEQEPIEDVYAAPNQDEAFVVSDELYERTFEEVEQVIHILNELISSGDYEGWRSYLTDEYIQAIAAPENLAELNQTTLLQRNDIVLESLEDYFLYVVVPSRQNLRLDDLDFIDDNTVQAIMIIRDRPAILYLLRRINGEWRISI